MQKLIIAFIIALYFTTVCAAEPAKIQEERFSIRVPQSVQLPDFIRSMAEAAGYDCVIDKKLDGITLVTFTDKTLPEAMDLLAKTHNFNWSIENHNLVVSRTDTASQMRIFNLRYADPEFARKDLITFLPEKQININPEASSLIVEGSYLQLAKAEKRIKELDIPIKQVHIKVIFIEMRQADSLKLGLSHTWGNYDNTKPKTFPISYAVTAEATSLINKGKILASPSILTLNGRQAEMKAGDTVPVPQQTTNGTEKTITYEDKEVGYEVIVTPRINEDAITGKKYVSLVLAPKSSTITGYVSNAGIRAPQMSTRSAKTNVRVENNGAVIIGGLIKDEELKNLSGIPYLSKIPILGELFKSRDNSKEKTEIFIIVIPEIIEDPPAPSAPVLSNSTEETKIKIDEQVVKEGT